MLLDDSAIESILIKYDKLVLSIVISKSYFYIHDDLCFLDTDPLLIRYGYVLSIPDLINHHIQYESVSPMTKKEQQYHQIIQQQLASIYTHMTDNLLGWLPVNETIDERSFTAEQCASVRAVEAIEEEWILDEERRAEVTLIAWED